MTQFSHESEELRELLATLWSLRAYLPQLTLIGGWIPELYRRYSGIKEWNSRLSQTREADVLIDLRIDSEGRPLIADSLRAAGFRPLTEAHMPAIWLSETARGAKIEFMTGLARPAMQQAKPVPVQGQPGLGALPLPDDLSILARHTRFLEIHWREDDKSYEIALKVPELAPYVVNKVLTSRRRPVGMREDDKRPKDLLYLHDLSSAGPEVVAQIAAGLRTLFIVDARAREHVLAAAQVLATLKPAEITAAAVMLAERDALSSEAARASIAGHMQDLSEILADVIAEGVPDHER